MVRCDAEGVFTYCGRGDDMLKVSGKWLSPGEVENCLLGHEDVVEAAVVGAANREGLTKPYAFVTVRSPATDLPERLTEWLRRHLEPYKIPRRISVLSALPRTHLGKVDRGKLRAGVESGERLPQTP